MTRWDVSSMIFPMKRLKLPIGIQTLAKIHEGGCYYVDKTAFALDLIEKGGYYYLSLPRRRGTNPPHRGGVQPPLAHDHFKT